MIPLIGQMLGGLALLLVGGRLLVSASVDTARRLSVSELVVGLTLVAWGTSAPELALNLVSALKGRGELALGNVVGANICNMALVLGVCALLRPLAVEVRLIRVETLLNAAILVFMSIIGLTAGFARWEMGLMLGIFGGYSVWTIMSALQTPQIHPTASMTAGEKKEARAMSKLDDDPTVPAGLPPMGWVMIFACFGGGLALLSWGGSLASDSASAMAIRLGVPAAVVGVTIVSIGTTLPEMVTGVMAVLKGQSDLAMGNAIGSCLFNAGAIFGLTGLIAPPAVNGAMVLPLVYMGLLAIALVPISRTHGHTVARGEGAALLASYVVFLIISAFQAGGATAP